MSIGSFRTRLLALLCWLWLWMVLLWMLSSDPDVVLTPASLQVWFNSLKDQETELGEAVSLTLLRRGGSNLMFTYPLLFVLRDPEH